MTTLATDYIQINAHGSVYLKGPDQHQLSVLTYSVQKSWVQNSQVQVACIQ
jgi:hypothetical protein